MDSSTDSDNCSIATSGLGCGTNSRTFIHASSTEVERGSGWVGDAEGASTRLANNDGIDQALDNALDFYQADMYELRVSSFTAACIYLSFHVVLLISRTILFRSVHFQVAGHA
jgi:hypothetical protein